MQHYSNIGSATEYRSPRLRQKWISTPAVMPRGNKDSFLSRIICLSQARLVEPIVREQWRRIVPFSRIHLTEHRVYSTLRTGREREGGERPPSMAEEEGRMTSHFKRNSSGGSRTFFPSSSPTIITRGPLRRRSGNGEGLHTAIICNKSPARCFRDRRQASSAGGQFTKPTPSSRGGLEVEYIEEIN